LACEYFLRSRVYSSQRNYVVILFLGSLCLASLFVCAGIDIEKMMTIMRKSYSNEGIARLSAWQQTLTDSATLDDIKKLEQINLFFNQKIIFSSDQEIWKHSDYWATPLETLGQGRGDCEDFTIAKYLSLLSLNVDTNKLRLIYVKARMGGVHSKIFQAHMVLGYYSSPNAIPYILDNLIPDIEPASERTDLQPIYSFNMQGLWVGNQYQKAVDPTTRLSRWRDVLARIQKEGIVIKAAP
jgi:predicted transglutaminase-like cysteine proteinase